MTPDTLVERRAMVEQRIAVLEHEHARLIRESAEMRAQINICLGRRAELDELLVLVSGDGRD